MEGKEVGYVVGFEDMGGSYIIDGLVRRENGKYEYIESQKYRSGVRGLRLVNDQDFIYDAEDVGKQDGAGTFVGACENAIEGVGVYHTLRLRNMRKNCHARMHYIQEDKVENMMYIRVAVSIEKDKCTNTNGFNVAVVMLTELNDMQNVHLTEEEEESMLGYIEAGILLEVLRMRKVVSGIESKRYESSGLRGNY